jgi:hypothetical protein
MRAWKAWFAVIAFWITLACLGSLLALAATYSV